MKTLSRANSIALNGVGIVLAPTGVLNGAPAQYPVLLSVIAK
jgi:hypothetical protein